MDDTTGAAGSPPGPSGFDAGALERLGRAWRDLPPGFGARIAAAGAPPSAPRDAATVVLLRDSVLGIEAYLLRRVATMEFAPRTHVFPGGAVDPADAATEVGWIGPALDEIARALRAEPPLARALVCAAVRETFEETGVLLAGRDADSIADTAGPEWDAARRALEGHRQSLADLLARHDLALRADLVLPWARWITPVIEPRRYDTRFFVAALPAGQQPRGGTSEADRMIWLTPPEALTRRAEGHLTMLPPTAYTLAELSEFDDVASVLAAARVRDLAPVMPRIVVTGDEARLLLPHEEGYGDGAEGSDHGGGEPPGRDGGGPAA